MTVHYANISQMILRLANVKAASQTVYDVNNLTEGIKVKMKDYGVKAVPTTIIDGKIKIVGIPNFPWICGQIFRQYSPFIGPFYHILYLSFAG